MADRLRGAICRWPAPSSTGEPAVLAGHRPSRRRTGPCPDSVVCLDDVRRQVPVQAQHMSGLAENAHDVIVIGAGPCRGHREHPGQGRPKRRHHGRHDRIALGYQRRLGRPPRPDDRTQLTGGPPRPRSGRTPCTSSSSPAMAARAKTERSARRATHSGATPPRCSRSLRAWPRTSTVPSCSQQPPATCSLAGTSPPSPFRSRTSRSAAPTSPCGPGSACTGTVPGGRSAGRPIRCCGRCSSRSPARTPRRSTPVRRSATSPRSARPCGRLRRTWQNVQASEFASSRWSRPGRSRLAGRHLGPADPLLPVIRGSGGRC
jgi:hypothetical protein